MTKRTKDEIIKSILIKKESMNITKDGLKIPRLVLVQKNTYKSGVEKQKPLATLYKSPKNRWLFIDSKVEEAELIKLGFCGLKALNEGSPAII